jgi:isopenicillin-N N-acyltransferase like protein
MATARCEGFKLIRLVGEPYARGVQHGRALRTDVWALWEACERLILNARGPRIGWGIRQTLVGTARLMERFVDPELRLELRGVADGSGLAYSRLLLLNCFDDLMGNLRVFDHLSARFACSAFAAVGDQAADGVAIAGRNLDYWFRSEFAAAGAEPTDVLRRHVVVFSVQPAQGRPFISVGWPGLVNVVTGQNAAGLALACLTSPAWSERPWGTPLPFLYRLMLQYDGSLAEAAARLRGARRTIGNNLLVVSGADRDARVFEFTARQVAERATRRGVVATTNHFQAPPLQREQVGLVADRSLHRARRLEALLASETVDVEGAAAVLSDDFCLDESESAWARLYNSGTVYSTVFEPAAGRLWLRTTDRPGRDFVPLAVPSADRMGDRERGRSLTVTAMA